MIAGDRRRKGEGSRNESAKDSRPGGGKGKPANGEGQSADDGGNKECPDHARAAVKRRHACGERNERRQRPNCEGEDQPAEQADTEGVENEKDKHGGGSVTKGTTVAPSTTTTMARIRL